ncbi:MAG: LamG domain-containing protein, partial [Simkania sp.]|nr:LamG domain-containing protein [Simkania sp.]
MTFTGRLGSELSYLANIELAEKGGSSEICIDPQSIQIDNVLDNGEWRPGIPDFYTGATIPNLQLGYYGVPTKQFFRFVPVHVGPNVIETASVTLQSNINLGNPIIFADADDGYWVSGGSLTTNDFDRFGKISGNNTNCFLRYKDVYIAQGDTVGDTRISFLAEETNSTSLDVTIVAVAEDNATAPATATDADGRSVTSASVSWTVPSFAAGPPFNYYTSPDISSVIQEIVDRAGWTPGNHIVLYVLYSSGAGNRASAGKGDGGTHPGAQPYFQTDTTDTRIKLRIFAFADDNATAPTDETDAESRVLTSAYVDWNPTPWQASQFYDTPDISPIITEIITRPGWTSGNAIVITTQDNGSDTGNNRWAFLAGNGTAPVLNLTIDCISETPSGGFEFSGEAPGTRVIPIEVDGEGFEFGGTASPIEVFHPDGGIEFTGEADHSIGGMEFGGHAPITDTPSVDGEGFEFGGSAIPYKIMHETPIGGLELGGEASTEEDQTFIPSGGFEFSGLNDAAILVKDDGICSITYRIMPAGGFKFGGTAPTDQNWFEPTGGFGFGGGIRPSVPNQLYEDYEAIYHLLEQGDGTVGEFKDSTTNAYDAQGGGGWITKTPNRARGLFYRANLFDGSDYINTPEFSLNDDQAFTVSLWAKRSNLYFHKVFFSMGRTENESSYQIAIGHTDGQQLWGRAQVVTADGIKEYRVRGRTVLETTCWYHIAIIWEPFVGISIYLDGLLEGFTEIPYGSLAPSITGSYIGRKENEEYFEGKMQEV